MKIKLREIRMSKGLSINQLADMSGLSKGTISKIENQNLNITVETFCTLCRALHVSIDDLVDCSRRND